MKCVMRSQITKWCKQRVSRLMIRPLESDPQELATVAEFRGKIPELYDNIKCLTTSKGNDIYYVHLDYKFEKTIVYSHGNGNCLYYVGFLEELCQRLKCNGIFYDYSGFGVSGGEYYLKNKDKLDYQLTLDNCISEYRIRKQANNLLSQLGFRDIRYQDNKYTSQKLVVPQIPDFMYDESTFVSDIRCIFDYLTKDCQVKSENITLYGNQIGTFPTIKLAALLSQENIAINGIVLERVMGSVLRVCMPSLFEENFETNRKNGKYWKQMINEIDVFNNFDTIDQIKNVSILFMHDKHDIMCSFDTAKEMYQKSVDVNDNVATPLWVENVPIFGIHLEMLPHPDKPGFVVPHFRHSYVYALKTFV